MNDVRLRRIAVLNLYLANFESVCCVVHFPGRCNVHMYISSTTLVRWPRNASTTLVWWPISSTTLVCCAHQFNYLLWPCTSIQLHSLVWWARYTGGSKVDHPPPHIHQFNYLRSCGGRYPVPNGSPTDLPMDCGRASWIFLSKPM